MQPDELDPVDMDDTEDDEVITDPIEYEEMGEEGGVAW